MPRANRYLLPARTYHLTHRCHNRSFLLRFAKDRTEYRRRLRLALQQFDVTLLTYCITSNHTHLLVRAGEREIVSALMQKLEGEFAEFYNLRKKRSGAFWSGRYHGSMIDDDTYLRRCMSYIDLNMFRAGVVAHPRDWAWCEYSELMGLRQRCCLVSLNHAMSEYEAESVAAFRERYEAAITDRIANRRFNREREWTESIAVGSEAFVRRVESETRKARAIG